MTPERFKKELKHFDRHLDLVYNGKKARWEIIGRDSKNIQYLIKSFALGKIETMGMETIREMAEVSPVKSSAKDVNRRIDRILEEEEKQEERGLQNAIHDRLDESWERLCYAEGSRVSFALMGQKENYQNSFVVTDKRRFMIPSSEAETTKGNENVN